MSQPESNAQHAWDLMKHIGVGLFVTHDGHGDNLRARPVHTQLAPQENAIFFLTNADAKTREIDANHNACIAYADTSGQKYVSVTGSAAVSDDRAKIKELWTSADRAFWNDANDPTIRVVRITPSAAEYWDSPGSIVTAVKLAYAGATGAKPKLGEHRKVDPAQADRR